MVEIIKASAGSGKTYTLAKKYLKLLLETEDRYAYRHILAVTFTNKATEEMKSRILKELHILATQPAKSDYYGEFVPKHYKDDAAVQEVAKTVLCNILHAVYHSTQLTHKATNMSRKESRYYAECLIIVVILLLQVPKQLLLIQYHLKF